MNELRWFLESDTPARRYAVELLSDATGLRARIVDRPPTDGTPYIHHGRGEALGPRALLIPHHPDAAPILSPQVSDGDPPWRLNGDIVDGTLAFVTDAVHDGVGVAALDAHGRLRAEASHLAARGAVTDPVVNRYVAILERALPRLGTYEPRPRWPNGARAAIGISHDVDRPEKYAILRALREGRLPPAPRLPWFAARAARDFAHRVRDSHPDDFWLFNEVVAAEAAHGFRSTFLFSVVPAYAAYGSTNDVLYDAAWPHLTHEMRRLRGQGIELGLHASYNAWRRPSRFAAERSRLEELSGGPIRGLRHHFWQVGGDVPGTLRAHESAGFEYDSSLAFNDAVGLRRAIALPYRPWDAMEQRALRTWQLPVIALDSAACTRADSPTDAIDAVWAGIQRVIDVGGLAVLDWHVRCSYPGNERYRLWGETYLGILERLGAASGVWVAGLGQITDWAATRSRAIVEAGA